MIDFKFEARHIIYHKEEDRTISIVRAFSSCDDGHYHYSYINNPQAIFTDTKENIEENYSSEKGDKMKIYRTYTTLEVLEILNQSINKIFVSVEDKNRSLRKDDEIIRFYDGEKNIRRYGINMSLTWTEVIPKTKLTQFEYQILVNRPEGYDWVARDRDTSIYFYTDRPKKINSSWDDNDGDMRELRPFNLSFLSWKDEEPCYIPDLLENCEIDDSEE